jgi:enoyl-CoA hydratase
MTEAYVTVEPRDDGVALIRLDRPKMNALSAELLRQLAEVVDGLAGDPPGAVVIWGGERIFAAGADISELKGPDEARVVGGMFRTALDKLAALPRLTIAAVNGYALGGGCELALACDFRVVADNAKLGQPEILLGIIPGGGGSQRLARLVGPSVAKDLLCSGRQVGADEALRIGLANRVAPAVETLDAALAWAAELAAGPLAAQAMCKRLVDEGLEGPLERGLTLEQDLFAEVFTTEDAGIGVRSFLEHGPGKATFTGR